jgi:hypothetical protein
MKNRKLQVSLELVRTLVEMHKVENTAQQARLQTQGRRLRHANKRNQDLLKKLREMMKDHRREKEGLLLAVAAAVACRNARDSLDKKLLRRAAKVRVPTGVEELGKDVKAIGQFVSSVAVQSAPLIPTGLR